MLWWCGVCSCCGGVVVSSVSGEVFKLRWCVGVLALCIGAPMQNRNA